jgi:hypothetical protein
LLTIKPMTDVALSILALIAGGLSLELFADARPSIGYQDERGLSLRVRGPEALEEFQAGNPS